MKIIFLVAALKSGGSERTVTYLAPYFASKGYDTTVVTLDSDVFYELPPSVKLVKMGIPLTRKRSLLSVFRAFLRYLRSNVYILKERPEVVVCILPDTVKYLVLLHKFLKFRLITSERNNPMVLSDRDLKQRVGAFKESDGVIFQTEVAQNFYSSDVIKKSVVIHNAVGNPYVYKIGQADRKVKKFVAIGRLENRQKDYVTMIDAFEQFLTFYPDFYLEIFGEGSDEAFLTGYIRGKNLTNKVILMGTRVDAIMEANSATAYLISSRYEGMPNALMEAMAIGLPCISTDCHTGPRELIDDGVNGLLVPVGDAEAMCDAMLRIVREPLLAKKLGGAARKILEGHSIDEIAQKYLDFIIK